MLEIQVNLPLDGHIWESINLEFVNWFEICPIFASRY